MRGFRVKVATTLSFFCLKFPKETRKQKETLPNIEVCPESLVAMLEYWYIEQSVFRTVLSQCTSLNHSGPQIIGQTFNFSLNR